MATTEPKTRPGVDGNPDNDSDPVGGDMDGGVELTNPVSANAIIYKPKLSDVDNVYRGIIYKEGQSGTKWQSAKFTLRSGCNPPSSSGFPSIFSTRSEDTGKVWICYKHGGEWSPGEEIQLAGLTPVTGLVTIDEDSDIVLIYEPGVPTGDLHLSVNSEKLGVCYGGANGVRGINTLGELAVGDSVNNGISCSNRREDPGGGIGSFSRATWWVGQDNAIPIPGDDLYGGDYIGCVVRVRFPGGMTRPYGGALAVMVDLLGDAVED